MPLLKDNKLLSQWNEHKGISEGELNEQHDNARIAHLYNAGDEALYRAGVQEKSAKNQVVFSKIKPFVDAVKGFMIQLRRKPMYVARVQDSEQQSSYSSYMSSVSDYIRENANMDQLESRQDAEMLIAGYGAVDTNVIYEKNPDGEVAGEVLRYDDVFWDPQSHEPNLLDARWVYRRKAFDLEEALKRFKGSQAEDFESYDSDRSSSGSYIPGGEYDRIYPDGQTEEDLVSVYYYQYWTLEKYYRARNPLFEDGLDEGTRNLLGQMMLSMQKNRAEASDKDEQADVFEFNPTAEYLVMTPTIRSDMKELFERFELEIDEQEYLRRVYYTIILSGHVIFKKFKSLDQQGFTIKFKTGNYDPVQRNWYGMVAGMIEPARYANKSLSEILYVIAANSKGGVMYEESAVDDPARFEQQYSTTKAAIRVNDGALSGNRIQPKAQASLPTGYENVYDISNQALEQTSGIPKEFLGTSGNSQVSAQLESQRINQVLATLAGYFDSITLYQKEQARLTITYIHVLAENSEGRLVALLGEDGAKTYDVLSEDRLMDEYDIDISEAPSTPTQKMETARVVGDLADKLFASGKDIYPLVVDYIPGIKESDKIKIKQSLVPSPEQVQEQQQAAAQQAQQEQALNQSVVNSQNAKAQKDLADSEETKADILKTKAEIDETYAKTVKLLEEAKQTALENEVLKNEPVKELSVAV